MRAGIKFLRVVQWPFAWPFWCIERIIARIEDEIERRKS